MLIENISERTIPNVTVYTKGIIEVTYSFPSSAANSAKIDFGQMKFYTSDGQKVFYGLSGSGQANTAVIETYAHISGKIVIEVPSLYGEVNVSDSGDIANPAKVNLQINYKTPEMSDCRVTGTAYLLDENGKTPIPNAILRFHVRDPYTKEKFTITVTADADGKYVLNGFQDAYISQVDCLDADGETILHQRHYDDDVMMFGDAFVLDVTFEQVTPGNNLTAG
ncbi:MAG: hypothetical protein Q4F54_00325 [Coriobacteriia bacterium]|nr:hypothetical protein [Coriobacteriia bacterium]